MKSVRCPTCNKHVPADRSHCIGCGGALVVTQAAREGSAAAGTSTAAHSASSSDWADRYGWAVIGAVACATFAALWYLGMFRREGASTESARMSAPDALWLCQAAIKRATRDPETTDVPFVSEAPGDGAYLFVWGSGTRPVRARNGLGLPVAITAACTVDGYRRAITGLVVDGRVVR